MSPIIWTLLGAIMLSANVNAGHPYTDVGQSSGSGEESECPVCDIMDPWFRPQNNFSENHEKFVEMLQDLCTIETTPPLNCDKLIEVYGMQLTSPRGDVCRESGLCEYKPRDMELFDCNGCKSFIKYIYTNLGEFTKKGIKALLGTLCKDSQNIVSKICRIAFASLDSLVDLIEKHLEPEKFCRLIKFCN